MDIEVLMKKGQRGAAAYIHAECCRNGVDNLNKLLNTLLGPNKNIDDWDTIEWVRWLLAGGCTPDEFAAKVRHYDNTTTCGLVWTANFVAYRCRTCGISPCMSLCAECFQRGNHTGHDFNMFRSQAGGACDCGDTNVMKEGGFCYLHGPQASEDSSRHRKPPAPSDLLAVAKAMMPRLLLRLIQHLRQNSQDLDQFLAGIESADKFITMLQDLSSMGGAMRQVITHALTNPQVYKLLTDIDETTTGYSQEYIDFMNENKRAYELALKSLPYPDTPEEFPDIPSLQKNLVHRTFLDEFVFWTARFEFPQKIVCLLLNLLPDTDYKEAFTRAFVLHYSRISQLLVHSKDADTLSNRVVHVSVQLFSNEKLALRMTEQMGLLHVMVVSLKYMMWEITKPGRSSDKDRNGNRVVDCASNTMANHCYWPLVSDFNNILSHRPVAIKFLENDTLLQMWFSFLSVFQGMNVNHREINDHVEFEPKTYYAAFSAELEASAAPMWALVSHLRDSSTAHLTKNLLRHCRIQLRQWLENYDFSSNDFMQLSFHLPLHRYFAAFLYQAVRNQGLSLAELLPPPQELKLIILHPLRVQIGFYEVMSGLWVRNGLQMKGQAMTYIQCHFCNSMADADLYLLQVAMMNLHHGEFLNSVFERFHVLESLSISSSVSNTYFEPEQEIQMMENCLIFLASLASVRTSIGWTDSDLVTMEMVTILCMGDKTHSQLMELIPERTGNTQGPNQGTPGLSKDFEPVLARIADYRAPNFEPSGNMVQGMYVPKPFVWERLYDPIYVLLRAVHRKDFQTSLDRFTKYTKETNKFKGPGSPWPPYRMPKKVVEPYSDPRNVLLSKVLQGVLFVIFYKAVHTTQLSDQVVSLAVYLLEMALSVCDTIGPQVICPREVSYARIDTEFASWYKTDCLLANLRTEVDSVYVKTNPSVTSDSSEDVSVEDMEVESYDGEVDMFDSYDSVTVALMHNTDYPMNETNTSDYSSPAPLAIMPSNAVEPDVSLPMPYMLPELPERPSRPPPDLSSPNPPAINATMLTTSSSLPALLPPGVVEEELGGGSVGHITPHLDETQRQRGLQVVLAPAKPVATVHRKELIERSSSINNRDAAVEVVVNESMISLLLKLHSKLSGLPDSYVPYWETPVALKIIEEAKHGLNPRLHVKVTRKPNPKKMTEEESPQEEEESSSSSQNQGQEEETVIETVEYSYNELHKILNPDTEDPENRIGDGAFFVGKILDQIAAKDELCRESMIEIREKLWPRRKESDGERKERERREKDERRLKARERQLKLMAEFAKKQKQFMESAMSDRHYEEAYNSSSSGLNNYGSSGVNSENYSGDEDYLNSSGTSSIKPIEYDCVICNQTSTSTCDNPIGFVTLVQSTSTLGHRRKKGSKDHKLPTNDDEKLELTTEDTMTYFNERRLEEFGNHFDDSSWLLSISCGWKGGVHLQTCGHHLHMECLKGYLGALKTQHRPDRSNVSVDIDRGEYSCPLCRQLANSFLPLSPEFGIRQSALVKDRKTIHAPSTPEITVPEIPPSPEANVALEVMKLLREYPNPTTPSKLQDAITKIMEEMTNATHLKYRQVGQSKIPKSILLFVSSIARTNLELEIVFRGGNLVSVPKDPQPSTSSAATSTASPTAVSKRSCIVPLLYVLGFHYKILSTEPCSPKIWERILGIRFLPDSSLMPVDREVPMLLRDPCATLLHLLMTLPMHVDLAYFTEIVQAIYNLVYVQILCGLSMRFSEKEREDWKTRTSMLPSSTTGDFNEINVLFGHIIRYLESSPLYIPDSDFGDRDYEMKLKDKKETGYTERELDSQIQALLLPYLRVAALLRHQIYEQELPYITTEAEEFGFLARFLGLGGKDQQTIEPVEYHNQETLLDVFKADKFLRWISPTPLTAIWTWCEDLISFIVRARVSASYLIETHHILWGQPKLLELPQNYDVIFQFYHRKPCTNCGQVPKDPNVCLVCGALVCMRESCCKQPSNGMCEAIQHSIDCGAGTAMFLSINLSTIVVVRGRRACLWGSVYLDAFGEEDRDLKRGRPLFLSKERYQLLQQQWTAHRFDHTNRKWIWHRDTL